MALTLPPAPLAKKNSSLTIGIPRMTEHVFIAAGRHSGKRLRVNPDLNGFAC
jgi:hypothetical protein